MSQKNRGSAVVWIVVLIVFAAAAFYLGLHYGTPAPAQNPVIATSTSPVVVQEGSEYYSNVAEWQSYQDTAAGYAIAYPIDFSTDEPLSLKSSTDWLTNNVAQAPGFKIFTLTIPKVFEPQTNFSDATLTVGYSKNAAALADCLIAQNGESTSTPVAINNADFTVLTSNDAGAGNLYETTSYRTTHAGACYVVEYTVHSAQLGNYPTSYNLSQFDETRVRGVLDTIVGTFRFL